MPRGMSPPSDAFGASSPPTSEDDDDDGHHPAPELLDPRSAARRRSPEQAQPQAETSVLLLSREELRHRSCSVQPSPVGMGQRRVRSSRVLAFQFRDRRCRERRRWVPTKAASGSIGAPSPFQAVTALVLPTR